MALRAVCVCMQGDNHTDGVETEGGGGGAV